MVIRFWIDKEPDSSGVTSQVLRNPFGGDMTSIVRGRDGERELGRSANVGVPSHAGNVTLYGVEHVTNIYVCHRHVKLLRGICICIWSDLTQFGSMF